MADGIGRRDLFKLGAAVAAGFVTQRLSAEGSAPPKAHPLPLNGRTTQAMPTRNLGRTGHLVGLFSLGGQASIEKPDNAAVAIPLIERALDLGVNYLDTSARYGGPDRWSERYFGEVMKRRRHEAYLASKTANRTREGAMKDLELSLKLLNTDHLDLWQLHNLQTMADLDKLFAKGGAIEAFQQAREQGLVRHLGLTGHADPEVLKEGIRRFPFDTVLMAFNAADPHYLSFRDLLDTAVGKEMGIIGMKIPARGKLLGAISMKEAMRYALSFPFSTVIVGCDTIAQLEEDVAIARAFTPMSTKQLADLEARTKPVAEQSLTFRRRPATK